MSLSYRADSWLCTIVNLRSSIWDEVLLELMPVVEILRARRYYKAQVTSFKYPQTLLGTGIDNTETFRYRHKSIRLTARTHEALGGREPGSVGRCWLSWMATNRRSATLCRAGLLKAKLISSKQNKIIGLAHCSIQFQVICSEAGRC